MPADPNRPAGPRPSAAAWCWRDEAWWRENAVDSPAVSLQTVEASVIIDLRRTVLRAGRHDLNAGLADDDAPTSCHLAARAPADPAVGGGPIIGCVSVVARTAESLPLQLSLMAVAPAWQGRGVGAALVRCTQKIVSSSPEPFSSGLWANARDTALGFYERLGFVVIGDGFLSSMDLPHHRVLWRASRTTD